MLFVRERLGKESISSGKERLVILTFNLALCGGG